MFAHAHAHAVPFTFGQSADMSPAFDFAGHPMSSPLTGDSTRQTSFLSPPMWQQQQQQQQQQLSQHPSQHQRHVADNAPFTTKSYSQPAFTAPPPHHSPNSINNGRASSSSSHSSPEPPAGPKKRKMSSDEDDLDSPSSTKKEKGQPPKKTAHNMIEKRYRTNLNDKIAALRDSVPSLRVMSRPNGTEEDDDPEDLEGLTPAHKLNKATVLSKATEYIRHLEKRNKRMADEITALQARLDSYEKLSMAGQMNIHGNHASTPDGSRYQEDPFAPAHGMPMHGPTQGMIPVPDNIAALQRGLPPQQHYAPAYPQYANNARPNTGAPMVNARRSGGMVGKLMVGSLAGLMVLDGIVEHRQSQGESADRGLFAFPIHLATSILAPRVSFGVSTAQIPLAKLVLVFGAVFWLIAPLLNPKAKPKKKTSLAVQLKPAPSIASPLEVRQKAWLTAIQTVWVPQHNFMLEVAALGLKTLKLSTRKIIGWPGYAYLTGLTQEQEGARIKAWEIALDAQLTGGDAEISKSRLLLTLLASGTLPDTPARLMLKALHIRVLLWEIANTGHGSWWTMDDLSAKLARSYWNMARSEHRIASNLASKQEKDVEPLPDHLAALIEKECDDVLIPAIVQRAYNLAWNPTDTEKTTFDISMDSVVEDSAISSPLDAVAAWYSGVVLKKVLASTLATKKSGSPKDYVVSDLALAVQSAPPNSQAQLRALVAQAVVLDDNRIEHIGLALQALPYTPQSTNVSFMNLVGTTSVAQDICDALTLAKCLSLLEVSNSTAHLRAISGLNRFYLCESTTTLLSFVAAYKVLTRFMQEASLQTEKNTGLERLASSMRMWVGHGIGKRSGLSNKVRGRIVERCLDASKTLVGFTKLKNDAYIDDGYASASVKDD